MDQTSSIFLFLFYLLRQLDCVLELLQTEVAVVVLVHHLQNGQPGSDLHHSVAFTISKISTNQ